MSADVHPPSRSGSVDPGAMQRLIAGATKHVAHLSEDDRRLYRALAEGQNPEVLFITCSDSRVSPNRMIEAQPGELFVLRNVGNVVPPYDADEHGTAAAVEFAVGALGVKHIVICGHEDCGAMKALLWPEKAASMPSVRTWLAPSACIAHELHSEHPDGDAHELVSAAVERNTRAQLANLKTHPAVRKALDEGKLSLHAWVFSLDPYEIRACDPSSGTWVSLTSL